MLEEILKAINSNLERIAKALETQNIDAVADMVHESAKQFKQSETTAELLCSSESLQTQVPQQSVQNSIPVQTQQPSTIPTTQMQESFTQEQLAVAMSNAVSAGKMGTIQNILQQFGVQALTQINPADYNKVATMLKESGVSI